MITYVKEQFEKMNRLQEEGTKILSKCSVYENDLVQLHDLLQNYNCNLLSLQKTAMECASYLPEIDNYSVVPVPPTMRIYLEDGVYHYILNDLLPHRASMNMISGKVKYSYNKDIIYSGYRMAVEEYAGEKGFHEFREKIMVGIINVYNSKSPLCDHDNLDIKPFIDAAIKGILIPDDNPKWLSHLWDYRIGENEEITHTEIYAGRAEQVIKIVKEINVHGGR